jgi:hypothetical protein
VNIVDGGTFDNNTKAIQFDGTSAWPVGKDEVINSPTFTSDGTDYYLTPPTIFCGDLNTLFGTATPDLIQQPDGTFKQLYRPEQLPTYIPFPVSNPNQWNGIAPPSALVGLTNAQLLSQYGLVVSGAIAPADAVTDPSTNVLIGSPTTYGEVAIRFGFQVADTNLSTFKLKYSYRPYLGAGVSVKETQVTPLQKGWNLVTRTLPDGTLHTFLLFGL